MPIVAELVLSTKLLQIVNGQIVQVGDDFFSYCQLLGVVGVCYGDGVHSSVRYDMGFSASLTYRPCCLEPKSGRRVKAHSPFD